MSPAARPLRFTATLRRVGANLLVDVPPRVSAAFGKRGNVPVTATLRGAPFPQTLCPVGGGRHVLYVNQPMLAAAGGKREGERVTVTVAADARSRTPPMHPALGALLRSDAAARAAFEALTPSHRKEILRYLHALRSEETVRRNVERLRRRMVGIGR